MATVTTSIGVGGSHDQNVNITNVTGAGPYTVTLSAAISDSVNGDGLWDETATPAGPYLIESGEGTTTLVVRDSTAIGSAPDFAGGGQAQIRRYYTSLSAWNTELNDTDLYNASDDAVGECYNDANFTDVTNISGGATIVLTSIKCTVPVGERHDGTADTGVRLSKNALDQLVLSSTIPITFEWWEIDGNGTQGGISIDMNVGATDLTLANVILHHTNWNFGTTGIQIGTGNNDTSNVLNNLVYALTDGQNSTANARGISRSNSPGIINVMNNTVHDIVRNTGTGAARGFETSDRTNHAYQNNISTDPSGSSSGSKVCWTDSSITTATASNNAASDATAPGTSSLNSQVSSDLFFSTTGGAEDLHLKSGSNAIDAGTDLGTTPTGVNIDIDGFDRDADISLDPWDMGAHEFEPVVVTQKYIPMKKRKFIYDHIQLN